MAEITKTVSKTINGLDPETLDIYNKIKIQLDAVTDAEAFTQILSRFYQPLKVDAENVAKIKDLEQQLSAATAEREQLRQQLEESDARANHNAEEANRQQLEHESAMEALRAESEAKNLKETQRVVDFVPDCLKAVEIVAARESKRRNQQWTVSHVINFFIHSRFINGDLNGDLKALSDDECRKNGIALKQPSKKMEGAEV